ncbi:MAG: hypothetical protein ABI397_02310 [Candidatus Saccharimonas sp.]
MKRLGNSLVPVLLLRKDGVGMSDIVSWIPGLALLLVFFVACIGAMGEAERSERHGKGGSHFRDIQLKELNAVKWCGITLSSIGVALSGLFFVYNLRVGAETIWPPVISVLANSFVIILAAIFAGNRRYTLQKKYEMTPTR